MESIFKSKVYILPGLLDIFGTDWITRFDLWKLSANSFYKNVDVAIKEKSENTENFISDSKNEFHRLFSVGLGKYIKKK